MNAITIRRTGGSDVLQFEDIPAPTPGRHEVMVRNRYVGVNHGDIKRRRAAFQPQGDQPRVLGFEGVGTVIQVGEEVSSPRVGDCVAYLTPAGAYAELVSMPASQTFRVPANVALPTAAASVCVGATAWHLLHVSKLEASNTAVIHGAAGGVGAALLQLGHLRGGRLIATVGSEEKAQYASACGADVTVLHTREDFAERVIHETGGVGADAVFDCVGQSVVDGNVRCLRQMGKWLYYGSTSGHAAFPGLAILSKSIRLTGFVIFEVLQHKAWWARGLKAVEEALETGTLEPRVEVFPASAIREVHDRLEDRKFVGKAVLDMEEWHP